MLIFISEVMRDSPESNSIASAVATTLNNKFKNNTFEISPRGQCVKAVILSDVDVIVFLYCVCVENTSDSYQLGGNINKHGFSVQKPLGTSHFEQDNHHLNNL